VFHYYVLDDCLVLTYVYHSLLCSYNRKPLLNVFQYMKKVLYKYGI